MVSALVRFELSFVRARSHVAQMGEELTLIISQKGKADSKLLAIVAYLLYISPLEFGPGS